MKCWFTTSSIVIYSAEILSLGFVNYSVIKTKLETLILANLTTTLHNFTNIRQEQVHRQGNQISSVNSPDELEII